MDANQWRIHDELTVRFSKILLALRFPDVLSDPPLSEGQQKDMIRAYLHNDPIAYNALRALVHAAVDSLTSQPKK
jgi:hypothetical protein